MKTPMQELIERLECLIGLSEGTKYEKGLKYAKEQAESMLEKEEKVMCKFATAYTAQDQFKLSSKDYYDETFKTKER